jgi:hypothetical protein
VHVDVLELAVLQAQAMAHQREVKGGQGRPCRNQRAHHPDDKAQQLRRGPPRRQ